MFKKIIFIALVFITLITVLPITPVFAITDNNNGDWSAQYVTLKNTNEAEFMVRVGDIDNSGFGFETSYNPFSGASTPMHDYPWDPDSRDFDGTDRIMMGTKFNGDVYDGYSQRWINDKSGTTTRPIVLSYDLSGIIVNDATLQIFIDDFQAQAPNYMSNFFVKINGRDAPFIADLINNKDQTGPISQLISMKIPNSFYNEIQSGTLSIFIDEITGFGDGFAIDFVKLLVNPLKKAIYVLPGYLGSRLYEKEFGYEAWINFLTIGGVQLTDRLNEGGIYVETDYFRDEYGTQDTFRPLIDKLRNEFDPRYGGIGYDVIFHPWNWLSGINDAVVELEKSINEGNNINNIIYDQVVFVTHSTGGLLASAYVAKNIENYRKVENAILIAAPLFGTYSALKPIEMGDSHDISDLLNLSGMFMDAFSSNKWVKKWSRNSITGYQLLPSVEYFDQVNDALVFCKEYNLDNKPIYRKIIPPNGKLDDLYLTLKKSDNIENFYVDESVYYSHKGFREKSLTASGKKNIIEVLREIKNVTLIGSLGGFITPRNANYEIMNDGSARLVFIGYGDKGDGTVYENSTFGISKGIDKLNPLYAEKLKHTQLVKDDHVIKNFVIRRIRNVENKVRNEVIDDYVSTYSLDEDGIQSYINIYISSDKLITIRIYDDNDNLIAVNSIDEMTGFDGQDFICDNFGDENETLTSIFIPKKGYIAKFYYGNESDIPIDFGIDVSLLDSDGYKTAIAEYIGKCTGENGEILALNMLEGISTDNIDKLAVDDTIISVNKNVLSTDWELSTTGLNYDSNGRIILDSLGSTGTINIVGSDVPKDILWYSADPSVVTVDSSGNLYAEGYGFTTITAYSQDGSLKSRSVNIKVVLEAKSIYFEDIEMQTDDRLVIYPIFDSDLVTETEIDFIYDESAGIITIDDGLIIALSSGVIEVTAVAPGGASCNFLVNIDKSLLKKEELKALLIEAEALEQNNYSTDSWEAMIEVYNTANTIMNNIYTAQDEINSVILLLRTAINALVPVIQFEHTNVFITGPKIIESGAGMIANYTISAENMPNVTGIELEFEINDAFLSGKSFISNNFDFIGDGNYNSPIYWRYTEGIWIGKISMVNAAGISGTTDILNMTFNVNEGVIGEAKVNLKYLLMSYNGFSVPVEIKNSTVTTKFIKYYNRYDLNQDGNVNLNDITYAIMFFMTTKEDPNWNDAKEADLCEDGKIDIADLILILANYTIPYYN